MLWLYLLGAVTILVIVLRRVLRRQEPLKEELSAKRVVIDHVHSGAAWINADGTIGEMNPSLAATLGVAKDAMMGRNWFLLFAPRERDRVTEAHGQMLLAGISSLDADTERADGSVAPQNVVLLAVYNHKTQFMGHHCLTVDRTQERVLEGRVQELTDALEHLTGALERVQAAAQRG